MWQEYRQKRGEWQEMRQGLYWAFSEQDRPGTYSQYIYIPEGRKQRLGTRYIFNEGRNMIRLTFVFLSTVNVLYLRYNIYRTDMKDYFNLIKQRIPYLKHKTEILKSEVIYSRLFIQQTFAYLQYGRHSTVCTWGSRDECNTFLLLRNASSRNTVQCSPC